MQQRYIGTIVDGWSLTLSTMTPVCVGPSAAPAGISGNITDDAGNPVGGVVMSLSGAASATTITDSNGNYHFDNVETDNFYTVTPALANYTFAPESRAFSLLATGRTPSSPPRGPGNYRQCDRCLRVFRAPAVSRLPWSRT